ncbi:MAG: nuclear transport factor 2 family protein [Actinomycetia bacterium]|nr:nuclear transport factor 2 family protein [bacterium]MCG2790817.1 nuclear transport factor 2 family protein [Actinomycetes bacterium]
MMKFRKIFFILVLFIFSFSLFAFTETTENIDSIGKELVQQLWVDFKTNNWEEIEKQMGSGFQSVHQDGTRDKDAQIELLKGLDLSDYIISDYTVTAEGPVIIVTYKITVEETLESIRLPERTVMRLSAWVKSGDDWKWIIHANLTAMK